MLNKNVLIALAVVGSVTAADTEGVSLDPAVASYVTSIWPGYYGWYSSFASYNAKSDYTALQSLVSDPGYLSYLSAVASEYKTNTDIFTNTDSAYAYAGTASNVAETGLASATETGSGASETGSVTDSGSAS